MRTLILLSFLFLGCATRVRDPQSGKTVFETYGDAQNLTYTGPGYSLHVDKLTHSTATRAAGSLIGTAGTAFSISGLGAILKR